MKIVKTIANYVLTLPFLILGADYFFDFIPKPELTGAAEEFMSLMMNTGYMTLIKIIEIILALMIVFRYQRPLAYLLLAPICLNILFFEVFMMGMPGIGLFLTLLNGFLIWAYRARYMPVIRTAA